MPCLACHDGFVRTRQQGPLKARWRNAAADRCCSIVRQDSKWFLAIVRPYQTKTRVPALEPKRHVGVTYVTAWSLQHRLMSAMTPCKVQYQPSGTAQVEDDFQGGERDGGNPGRVSQNKVGFLAAATLGSRSESPDANVTSTPRFGSPTTSKRTGSNLSPGIDLPSDGLRYLPAVTEAGCIPIVSRQLLLT